MARSRVRGVVESCLCLLVSLCVVSVVKFFNDNCFTSLVGYERISVTNICSIRQNKSIFRALSNKTDFVFWQNWSTFLNLERFLVERRVLVLHSKGEIL